MIRGRHIQTANRNLTQPRRQEVSQSCGCQYQACLANPSDEDKEGKRHNAAVIALARLLLKFFTMLRNGEPLPRPLHNLGSRSSLEPTEPHLKPIAQQAQSALQGARKEHPQGKAETLHALTHGVDNLYRNTPSTPHHGAEAEGIFMPAGPGGDAV